MNLNLYKEVAEPSQNLIWILTTGVKGQYFNRAWLSLTGKSLQEIQGLNWLDLIHPEDLDKLINSYLNNYYIKNKFLLNFRLKRHDNKYCRIKAKATPFQYQNEEGYIIISLDGYVADQKEKGSLFEKNPGKKRAVEYPGFLVRILRLIVKGIMV